MRAVSALARHLLSSIASRFVLMPSVVSPSHDEFDHTESPPRLCRQASIRTLLQRCSSASCGALWCSSYRGALPSLGRPIDNPLLACRGSGATSQSPPNSALSLGPVAYPSPCKLISSSLLLTIYARSSSFLRLHSLLVVQRFVCFSAHPQMMQQYRQPPRYSHNRPPLPLLATLLLLL